MIQIIGALMIIKIWQTIADFIASCFKAVFNIIAFIFFKKEKKKLFNPETKEEIFVINTKPRIIPCIIGTILLASLISYTIHIKQTNNRLSSAVYSVKRDIKKAKNFTHKVIPATKTYEIKSWEDKETGKIYIKGDKKNPKKKNFEITVK